MQSYSLSADTYVVLVFLNSFLRRLFGPARERDVQRRLSNCDYLLQMYCLVSMAPFLLMGRHHRAKHTRWKV
jgi:hypothetical protein